MTVFVSEIKEIEETVKLQKDIDHLGSWAWKWGMRFQPVKCNMMHLTKKLTHKIQASYTLEAVFAKSSAWLLDILRGNCTRGETD